jgi:type I restriction enzyme S subunit
LVVRTNGSRGLIGRAAPVVEALPSATTFASYLIRFRLAGSEALHRWLRWYWDSPLARRKLEQMAATSAGQYNLSQTALAKVPVPLPPLAEAEKAQLAIDDALSIAETEESNAAATLVRCQRLRQSILKWAFEGKLVDQDPNDEPASALLARIRAEREALAPAKKRLDPSTKKSSQREAAGASPKARRRKKASAA